MASFALSAGPKTLWDSPFPLTRKYLSVSESLLGLPVEIWQTLELAVDKRIKVWFEKVKMDKVGKIREKSVDVPFNE